MTRRLVALALAAALAPAALAPAAGAHEPPPPLAVAAASDLREALPALIAAHARQGGAAFTPTFGSSGKLAAQIQNGAPFDAFFSADAGYARKLEAAGLTRRGSRFAYGTGRLALWSRADGGVDVARGLKALADPRVARVAIANPAHAPYGRAAEAAMRHAGVYDAVKPKLVLGENVSQAAQFASTGAADVGLVARALLSSPGLRGGRSWAVPAAWHPAIVQEAVILERCPRPREAEAFFAFVRGAEGRKVLARYGFGPAPTPAP